LIHERAPAYSFRARSIYLSNEFQDVPLKRRQKAASEARRRCMRRWQFWFAVIAIFPLTAVASVVFRQWLGDDQNGTTGRQPRFCIHDFIPQQGF
jgi:hypothetical protein